MKKRSPGPKPPPSFAELPVIALAEMDEPTPESDETDGGVLYGVRDGLVTVWLWVKSLTVIALLLVAAALLVSRYEVWLPQAMVAAIRLFTGMDELKARISPGDRSQVAAATRAAIEQLPHLSVGTIESIMARSAPQVLDPTEVFQRATVAGEKGRVGLAPSALAELDSLTSALLTKLSGPEGDRLRRYLDRTRAGDATVPYEDNEAVWLTARGARRLPPESLSRLQELSAQAIALGLGTRTAAEQPALLPFKDPVR